MPWNQTLTNLRDILADLYPTVNDARILLDEAGVPSGRIRFDAAAVNNWHNILRYANNRRMVPAIITAAYEEWSDPQLKQYLDQGELPAIRGVDIAEDVSWQGPGDEETLEKVLGRVSTLLPISFLETGLQKARAVVRIQRADNNLGTGFLIADNLIVTNHHVLANKDEARGAVAQFNYQLTADGLATTVETVRFAPDEAFDTSAVDDWTIVKVQGNPQDTWGALPLQRANPRVKDWVNIIQHPMGEAKQIALYHNVIVFVGHNRLQYLTDTMPGSSGSPVFDTYWNVVALHHSGGRLREPGTSDRYYRNEGIHINTVIDGIQAAGF